MAADPCAFLDHLRRRLMQLAEPPGDLPLAEHVLQEAEIRSAIDPERSALPDVNREILELALKLYVTQMTEAFATVDELHQRFCEKGRS